MQVKKGWSISIFPTSWEFGKVQIRNKTVVAFGPFRLSTHRVAGSLGDYSNAS